MHLAGWMRFFNIKHIKVIFFTFNPNEWASPLTLLFRSLYEVKEFSLEPKSKEFDAISWQEAG